MDVKVKVQNNVTFDVGDVLIWHGEPCLVTEQQNVYDKQLTYSLTLLNGKGRKGSTFDTLQELIDAVNMGTFPLRVYSSKDYALEIIKK